MTTQLKSAIDTVAGALAQDASAAQFEVAAAGRLGPGFAVDVRVGERGLSVDMPEPFGGGDTAPTPGEYALAALGACQAITYRLWSERLGIRIDTLQVDVHGAIDVRGLVGVSDEVRPGFGRVGVDVSITGPERPERYEELRRAVDAHCPILDVFSGAVPTQTSVSTS